MDASATATSSDPSDILRCVESAQEVVNVFLAAPWKIFGIKKKDPELVKAFSRISFRLIELRLHVERETDRNGKAFGPVRSVLRRITGRLGRDAAWDVAEELKVTLLYLAPEEHLASLLEEEWAKLGKPGERWTALFAKEELDALRKEHADAKGGAPPARWRETVVDRLATLYQQRMDSWRHDRAHDQLRANYFVAVTAVLGGVLGLTAVLTLWGGGGPLEGPPNTLLLTAMATGALGSVLSGIYKLRDEMMGIRQLRSYWSVLTAQPFVGATAATLLFAVLTSGLIQVAGIKPEALTWQHHAVFGFLAGFSEPFFLGVVRRVAGLGDGDKKAPAANAAGKPPAPSAKPGDKPPE